MAVYHLKTKFHVLAMALAPRANACVYLISIHGRLNAHSLSVVFFERAGVLVVNLDWAYYSHRYWSKLDRWTIFLNVTLSHSL